MEYSLIRLTDRPELKAQAAAWFHAKWGVPEQAYLDSMDDALREGRPCAAVVSGAGEFAHHRRHGRD